MKIKELFKKFPIKIIKMPADVPPIENKTPERQKQELIFKNETRELIEIGEPGIESEKSSYFEPTDKWSDERLQMENTKKYFQIKIVKFFIKMNSIRNIIYIIILIFVFFVILKSLL